MRSNKKNPVSRHPGVKRGYDLAWSILHFTGHHEPDTTESRYRREAIPPARRVRRIHAADCGHVLRPTGCSVGQVVVSRTSPLRPRVCVMQLGGESCFHVFSLGRIGVVLSSGSRASRLPIGRSTYRGSAASYRTQGGVVRSVLGGYPASTISFAHSHNPRRWNRWPDGE